MGQRFRTVAVPPIVAGRLMVGIAIVGFAVGLVGTVVAWQLVTDLERGVGHSLELTSDVLRTVDESFVLAEDALVILSDGVGEAEGAVRALSRSMEEGQEALVAATDLTGGDVADAIESVEQGLPAIQTAAEAIDVTLAALSSLPFGPSYDPAESFGESIGALRAELAGLPDRLREQASQVEQTALELAEATDGTVATADSLALLHDRLADVTELVGEYARRLDEAQGLVDVQRAGLASSASRAQPMVVAFGLIFIAGQFVPLYLGLSLLAGPVAGKEP